MKLFISSGGQAPGLLKQALTVRVVFDRGPLYLGCEGTVFLEGSLETQNGCEPEFQKIWSDDIKWHENKGGRDGCDN